MSPDQRSWNLQTSKPCEDPDLTPRPLRVTKNNSVLLTNGDKSFATALDDQRSTIPGRKSSLHRRYSSATESKPPRMQSTPPNHDQPLRIPKQRTEHASSHGSMSAASTSRADLHMLLFESLGRKHAEGEASILRSGFRKAVRNGVLPQRLSRKLMIPSSNMVVRDSSLLLRNQSENLRPGKFQAPRDPQRRAFTEGEALPKTDDVSRPPPSRRISFKNRILRRSTIGKASEGSSTREFNDHAFLDSGSIEGRQDRSSTDTISFSASSIEKSFSDLPLPPSIDQSLSSPFEDFETFSSNCGTSKKELSEPYSVSSLAGKLSFTPEFESVNFENGDSLFALAQFEATLPSIDITADFDGLISALDFIVIIDNSLHTSPPTLMAHCETARYLASALDPTCDQVGLLCTSSEDESSHTLTSLARVDVKLFKKAIDQIGTCRDGMETAPISSLLDLAQNMLLHQRTITMAQITRAPVYGHICVLTQLMDTTLRHYSLDSRLTLHIICSDALPTKQDDLPSTNGWRIRSLSGDYPRPVSRNSLKKQTNDIALKMDRLISQARTGRKLGVLQNVEWELSSCKDTTIEKVWGADRIGEMQPGEVSTLMVKIRCDMPQSAKAYQAGIFPSLEESDDMFGEIERLFAGLSGTPLLRAAVSYSHPSLPNDTVCATMGTCNVRRYISSPGFSTLASRSKSTLFSVQRIAVHKCLALHCFTELDHQAAVAMLKNLLGEGSKKVACGQFVAALVKQQQYQSVRKISSEGAEDTKSPSSARSKHDHKARSSSVSPSKRNRETSGGSLPESKRRDDAGRKP